MSDCIKNTTNCLDCEESLIGINFICSDGCSDPVNSECVIYDGENISNGAITINNLESLTSIINKLSIIASGSNISIQLTFNQSTRQLCLKKNGSVVSCVTIPDFDNQELSLDVDTSILSISNGNSVDLSSLVSSIDDITTDDNSGIAISTNGNSVVINTIYNSLVDDAVLSQPIGQVPSEAASIWKTRTLVEALDRILFPEQLPTYTIPTITLLVTSGTVGIKEVGSTQAATFELTGVKNDAGVFTQMSLYRGVFNVITTNTLSVNTVIDVPDQWYTNPNNPNSSYSIVQTDSFVLGNGVYAYNGFGNYDQGLKKLTNYGNTDSRNFQIRLTSNPQDSGINFMSNSITVTGVYPFFYGMNVNASLSGTSLYTSLTKHIVGSGNKSYTYNDNNKYMYFAYPATYPNLISIKDPNNFEVLNSFNLSTVTVVSTGLTTDWSISYKVYRTNSVTTVNNGTFNFIF